MSIRKSLARFLHNIRRTLNPNLKVDSIFLSHLSQFSNYEIGRYTYGKPNILRWDNKTELKIGGFCSIAKNVTIILGGEHRIDWVTTYPFNKLFDEGLAITGHPTTKGNIIIGNDVWVGYGATILSGVTIGHGAVIGAKCVVSKSVDPYTIVGGNPQKVIRKRFSQSQIDDLLEIAWYDWSIAKITEALPLLSNDRIDDFISAYKQD